MKLLKKTPEIYRLLFARRFFYKWNRWLLKCSMKGLGIGNFGDPISGEQLFLKRQLARCSNPVIFDVGASVGEWALMALSANPTCQVYAFEPGNEPFKSLKQIPKIKAFNVACGAQTCEGVLYDRKDQPNSSHASLDFNVIDRLQKGTLQQPTKIITLDSIIQKEKISCVHLLKIDVEGFEYEVLQGAKEALANGVIRAIQFEFNEMNVYRRRFLRDFYDLLPEFEFYRLLPASQIPLRRYDPALHEIFTYQNLAAIRTMD